MRVLQINSVCGFGSTGKICTDLYDLLVEQGNECCIAYGRKQAPMEYKTIHIGTKYDNYAHVFLTRVFDKHGFGSKKATQECIQQIKEFNPDIIHLHNIHGYYINIELLFNYLKELNKPVVWTLHDCWSFTGHCAHFSAIQCEKWKSECTNCSLKNTYPNSVLFDRSSKNFKAKRDLFTSLSKMVIVTPSKWLADLVSQSYLKGYEQVVIHNGIDHSKFCVGNSNFKEQYCKEYDGYILGVASVFDESKGFDTFLQLRKDLDSRIAIVLIGLNDHQIEELPEGIIGMKRTSNQEELVQAYRGAMTFVNPTKSDTYPTTNLEAIACHTPVITSDVGGCKETIANQYGVLAKSYDDFLNAINEIVSGKLVFDFAGVEEHVDKKTYLNQYLSLYERLMKSFGEE